jgi:hypothetical protein
MVSLPHPVHQTSSVLPPNASPILFPCFTSPSPPVLYLSLRLLIPFFLHHSNAGHLHCLILPALPALPVSTPNHQGRPSVLLSRLFLQVSSVHTVNLIHIPSDARASSVRQQVAVVGNPSNPPSLTATDSPSPAARPLTRSKWNARNYLTAYEKKTLL